MRSERNKRRGGRGGEGARDKDGPVERPAETLEAADQIDGGANRREIEPVSGADIAPKHLAEMQRDAKGQGREPVPPSDRKSVV